MQDKQTLTVTFLWFYSNANKINCKISNRKWSMFTKKNNTKLIHVQHTKRIDKNEQQPKLMKWHSSEAYLEPSRPSKKDLHCGNITAKDH